MSLENKGSSPDQNDQNASSRPNFERWGAWSAGAETNEEGTQPLQAASNPCSHACSCEAANAKIHCLLIRNSRIESMCQGCCLYRLTLLTHRSSGPLTCPILAMDNSYLHPLLGQGHCKGNQARGRYTCHIPRMHQMCRMHHNHKACRLTSNGPIRPYGYPGQNGYNYGYPTYPYPYAPYWPPPPKRDGYRHAVAIVALICSILAILGGIGSAFFFLILALVPHSTITESSYLSSLMTFAAFSISGMVGGGFSLYHSIRGLLRKPSANIILPWFWTFLVLYLLVIGVGYALQANGLEVQYLALTIFLIVLSAIFPVLALASYAVRRLRFPQWPTTWRRFTLAITSGATLGIGLALLLELGLLVLVLRSQATNFEQYLTNPNTPSNNSFGTFALIFLVVAIIGPFVEETVKPLGVAFYIGRMRSAAEAFTLGMAAGIGFAMVETVGYIGSGYQDWLAVALERTAAGLLHGFGAGMVALGWYYLTHCEGSA